MEAIHLNADKVKPFVSSNKRERETYHGVHSEFRGLCTSKCQDSVIRRNNKLYRTGYNGDQDIWHREKKKQSLAMSVNSGSKVLWGE